MNFLMLKLKAQNIQRVVHFNQYQRLSIPLQIGILKKSNQFIYGISAGAVFNFTTQQSGKSFNANQEISTFEKEDSIAAFKSFGIGLRVNPVLGYQLSKNWAMTLQPQWTWNRSTQFDNTDLKIDFHQLNFNIGLEYYFR